MKKYLPYFVLILFACAAAVGWFAHTSPSRTTAATDDDMWLELVDVSIGVEQEERLIILINGDAAKNLRDTFMRKKMHVKLNRQEHKYVIDNVDEKFPLDSFRIECSERANNCTILFWGKWLYPIKENYVSDPNTSVILSYRKERFIVEIKSNVLASRIESRKRGIYYPVSIDSGSFNFRLLL